MQNGSIQRYGKRHMDLQIWVEDWQGKKKHKKKRGFASKKEALEWERNTLLASKTDMNMKLVDFVEVYFRD